MAYLTKYNLSKLCQKLQTKNEISLDMFLEHIYEDKEISYILNKREIEYLFVYKMLLDDENKFILEYYNEVPEKEDTKNMVFSKGGKMKYHLSDSCNLLKKDFLDFNIPEDIKSIGDIAVEEYREWFRSNNFAEKFKSKEIDKNYIIRAFNLKYPKKYDIKIIEENSFLLTVEIPNSSNEFIKTEFDLVEFKKNLNDLKLIWQNTFQCKVSRTFSKFKYLLAKSDAEIIEKMGEIFSEKFVENYGIENLKNKFQISKNLTYKILDLLLDYIKWSYNFENKEFENITLEKFGLECCYSCKSENKT
ncbi:MAG: hypothetical protein V4652_11890 [Bacteroidota bacterium]